MGQEYMSSDDGVECESHPFLFQVCIYNLGLGLAAHQVVYDYRTVSGYVTWVHRIR